MGDEPAETHRPIYIASRRFRRHSWPVPPFAEFPAIAIAHVDCLDVVPVGEVRESKKGNQKWLP